LQTLIVTTESGSLFVRMKKLTAFPELELPVGICIELACQAGEIFGKTFWNQGLNRGERFSRQLLSLFQTCGGTINPSGEQKGLFL
jgi:hypothetical protein